MVWFYFQELLLFYFEELLFTVINTNNTVLHNFYKFNILPLKFSQLIVSFTINPFTINPSFTKFRSPRPFPTSRRFTTGNSLSCSVHRMIRTMSNNSVNPKQRSKVIVLEQVRLSLRLRSSIVM